jgi:hypothetical protein
LRAAQTDRTFDTPCNRLETITRAIGLFIGLKP